MPYIRRISWLRVLYTYIAFENTEPDITLVMKGLVIDS